MKINYLLRTLFSKTTIKAPSIERIPPITRAKGNAGRPATALMKEFTAPKYSEKTNLVNSKDQAKIPARNADKAFFVSSIIYNVFYTSS